MESIVALFARLVALMKVVIGQTRRLGIVSQMLQEGKQVADEILLDCTHGVGLAWQKAHGYLADLQSSGGDTLAPLQAKQLICCAMI